MSAYNTVQLPDGETCASCGSVIRRRAQFKYGDTRGYDYIVGDRIRWGGNDIGRPARLVRVLGYLEECPVCGDGLDGVVELLVRDGAIGDVEAGDTRRYVEAGHSTYIVVED